MGISATYNTHHPLYDNTMDKTNHHHLNYQKKHRTQINARTRLRKRQKKEWAVAYKGGRCERCGYSKCIRALEFHHPNADKEFDVSQIIYFSYERLKKELDKCQLLCANCHREEE